jgi:DNA primase
MSTIDEVKQKTDIVDIISQDVRLTKSGRTMRGLCPFHTEKHPSFFVYPEQQSWHCFGCNNGGDVFSFIMKKQSIEFGEALRFLAERAGITITSKSEPETDKKEKERLYQINLAAAQYFHNLLLNSPTAEKARNHLSSKGISSKTIADFQLGYSLNSWDALRQYLLERAYTEAELLTAGLIVQAEGGKTHDRFRNRLMFPIADNKGRIIGFGARALDDSLPKYINSSQTPVFDKSSILYGIDKAATAIRQKDMAVIVEGYMDAITAHQSGFTNVVASMGTSITEKQVGILKNLSKNITLALDADAAGEEAMLRCVTYENSLDTEIKVIILPSGKDPDDVIKQDAKTWQHMLDEALPIVDYTFNKVASEFDLTTAKGKAAAVDKLLPTISEIKNAVRRAHYLQKLAQLVKVSEQSLEATLSRMKRAQPRRQPQQFEKPATAGQALRPLFSSPIEEYCLALLLQHPELKARSQELPSEYFESSENREVFLACQQTEDIKLIRERLDSALHEHFDSLIVKSLPATQIEQKYNDCVLRLREKYLRSLEAKKEAVLAMEAATGGTTAELAKLQEQGIEASSKLREVFAQRDQGRPRGKGGKNGLG